MELEPNDILEETLRSQRDHQFSASIEGHVVTVDLESTPASLYLADENSPEGPVCINDIDGLLNYVMQAKKYVQSLAALVDVTDEWVCATHPNFPIWRTLDLTCQLQIDTVKMQCGIRLQNESSCVTLEDEAINRLIILLQVTQTVLTNRQKLGALTLC